MEHIENQFSFKFSGSIRFLAVIKLFFFIDLTDLSKEIFIEGKANK